MNASPSTAAPSAAREPAAALRRLALVGAVLAGATYCLIVLGALVRAHGAGLACPDWPLCFGRVVPEFDLRVAFEWGHRAVAGSVALGFAAFAVAVARRPALRRPLMPLLVVATALLLAQVLLGALTVWHLLASWTVTSHLVTGNAFAATLVWTVAALRDRAMWRDGEPPPRPTIPGPVAAAVGIAAVLLVFQMVLGGLVASRFVGLACPEWPTCLDGQWFPTLRGAVGLQVLHRLNGYALWTALAVAALVARGHARVGVLLGAAWLVATAQIAVGVANVLWRIPVEITGLHSALAATLVALLVLCVREAWLRRPGPGATTAAA